MNKKLLPLALLKADDKSAVEGITRFQKLVFLAQREELNEDLYPFVAGSYGPFSKSLYDDLDQLVENGFIARSVEDNSHNKGSKQVYKLLEKGERALRNAEAHQEAFSPDRFEDFVEHYNSIGLWSLLDYVYEHYPEMAENSKLDI